MTKDEHIKMLKSHLNALIIISFASIIANFCLCFDHADLEQKLRAKK